MTARHDILDRPDSMKNPVWGSIILHGALAASMVAWAALPMDSLIPFGDPNSVGGGSVTITPISKIPMPRRGGQVI
ncbi:MAG: hypothetical protein GY953_00755, partial [bacterium]|nr:hypothetical protein [bacterium]